MHKIFTVAVLSAIFFTACDDIREEKFPSGKVRTRATYVEDKKEGLETEFYESGNVRRTRNFVKGKEQGESLEYYESGSLKSKTFYLNGALNDTATIFYENGKIQSVTLYKMGTIAGFPKIFDASGEPEIQGSYEDPRDGNRYEWVRIGSQVWTAENVKYAPVKGSVCMQCNVWGRLYDFDAAKISCPTDFRVPTVADWKILAAAAGPKPADKLKASFGWNDSKNGSDEFSFAVRASGAHFAAANVPTEKRKFRDAGEKAYFWTAERKVAVFAKNSSEIAFENFKPEFGASLRCILAEN